MIYLIEAYPYALALLLRKAKIVWSFGHSECNRFKVELGTLQLHKFGFVREFALYCKIGKVSVRCST